MDPTQRRARRLGLLYPGFAAEDDYPAMAGRLSPAATVELVHTSVGRDEHSVGALLDLGSSRRLTDGAEQLRGRSPDVVVWACTSGSFVFGPEGARDQVRELARVLDVPASSTSLAFVAAVRALGVGAVAVAATYPHEVAAHFRTFLAAAGLEVVRLGGADIVTAAEVGRMGAGAVRELVLANADAQAGALLVPDTAMRTGDRIAELEEAVDTPVLTANQVTLWEALRLSGWSGRAHGLGHLFDAAPPGEHAPA